MYNGAIKLLHLEPTSACNARCPQCPRTYGTSLETQPFLKIDEWTAAQLNSVLSDSFFSSLTTVLINGNYGDIVMHSDPKSLIEVMVDRGLGIEINTTGSALSTEFWEWLGEQPNMTVKFGIDGLDDTHHLYRRNTRFSQIIKNAQSYINAGGNAVWIMTLFKHNAHQIDECKKLAAELKFSNFVTRESTRFSARKLSVVDKNFNHSYFIEPFNVDNQRIENLVDYLGSDWYHKHLNYEYVSTLSREKSKHSGAITCQVQENSSVYLSYDKRLWPCCYTAIGFEQGYVQNVMYDSIIDIFKTDIQNDFYFNDVLHHSIDSIVNTTKLFERIVKTWDTTDVCTSCALNCKRNSRVYKQFQTYVKSNISTN